MSEWLGVRDAGSTVMFLFNTQVAFAGIDIGGGASSPDAAVISVYKNSTTESVAGVTLSHNYDNRTGMHQVLVDTSADGTFYAADNDFAVVITTGTVGGVDQSGVVLAHFRLATQAANVTKWNGTAVSSPATAGIPEVNIKNIANAAVSTTSAQIGVNVVNIGAASASTSAPLLKTLQGVARGTVTTGAGTTSIPTSALTIAGSAASGVVADQFKNRTVLFDGDTTTAGLRGASATISASSASNTPTLTVGALPATPASGDLFSII